MLPIPSDAKGVLFVVSTSHMDWHWISTFEQYYTMGTPSGPHYAVKYIFDQLRSLLPTRELLVNAIGAEDPVQSPNTFFRYNLAEVAWLRRYLQDHPEWAKDLAHLEQYFSFIGGGITSADSLVNNGEVFIRNFLLGREYVRQKGLGNLLSDNCWVPDDFGSDPQLPVVLKAMGFKGVSFARVPGGQASGFGNYSAPSPAQNQTYQLASNGVTFQWLAADNSSVLAYYMLCKYQNPAYGYPWAQQGASDDDLNNFIAINTYTDPSNRFNSFPVNQPGQIMMTPSGGDFAVPCTDLLQAVQDYNTNYYPSTGANYNNTGVYALMASFGEFVDYVLDKVKDNSLSLQTLQGWNAAENGFDPTSYWTGHFANYVQLKVDQQRTANRLLAAETLSTLLRAYSDLSSYLLDGLNNMIGIAWNDLVPSSHHDYVNGTAPTSIYEQEQVPLLKQALFQADAALHQGMHLLAESVEASPGENEIAYVVFNPAGTARTISKILEIPYTPNLSVVSSYRFDGNSNLYPIQHTAEGNLLILMGQLESTGYTVVYFSTEAPNYPISPIAQPPENLTAFFMNNGVIQIAIDKGPSNGWAINSIILNEDQSEIAGGLCNQILPYSESTSGNPYQMGNELDSTAFGLASQSAYQRGEGKIIESGPYRWRFQGKMSNTPETGKGESQLELEYVLELGDPLIRVRVKGNAAANTATSVVSNWNIKNAPTNPPAMSYGTANHWNGPNFTPPYWSGPVFRSTHDFVTINDPTNSSNPPLGVIYHEGMRAWAFSNGQLMGILLRNTNGNYGRGAQNADVGTHTQHYAFRVPGVDIPETCEPLQESMQFQMPLMAAPISSVSSGVATMAPTGYLASVTGAAIIRMARTQAGSGTTFTDQSESENLPTPFSFVLRLYQPTNASSGTWSVQIPFIQNNSGGSPSISWVSALEEYLAGAASVDYSNGVISLGELETLATLRVQSWRKGSV